MRFKTTTPKALLALAALAPVSAFASTTNPTVATWQMTTYDTVTANGLVETSQTSATGNTVKTRTDGLGRTLEQVDALGNVSTAEYDANGNLTKSRDANGVGQDCTYDAQNRRTACTDTAGSTRTTKYSVGGLVLNQQDAKTIWNAADAQYDARGRLTKSTSRLYANDATTYTYDANGNKLTVTDGEGKTTTYVYDNRNLKTAWTFPGQTSTTRGAAGYDTVQYQYDEAARLVAFLRQDGTEDDTTYNFNGTVASKTYKLANGTTESQDTYTYDASNRPLTASKGRYNNTVAFAYDAIGRKQEESLTVGGNTYPVQYQYDADNRVTQITYPDGKVATKTYTERNQLQSASFDGQAILTTAAYDAGGRETARTLGNGTQQTRTYRSDGLLSAITTQGDAASSLTYAYDANKNLTAETFTAGSATAGYSATMAQDAKDRLTQETRTNGDAQNWALTKEGDWAQFSGTANSTAFSETRTHNDNHQITALSSTANSPTYDAQGDLTQDEQARAYTWDQEKNLVGIVGGTTNVGFAYDALGRRVSKTSNGDTTVFVSAGNQEIAEYYNGALTKEHVYGTYVDENIATKDSTNGWQYRIMDRRYSTTALLDSTGAVLERYVYDAYGKTTALNASGTPTGNAPLTEILWTGRRLDGETGNYYFRSRYFSTTLGRFISRDIDYLDGANLYEGYFAERMGMDPSGMWTIERKGDVRADAVSEKGDTVGSLLQKIWLTNMRLCVKNKNPDKLIRLENGSDKEFDKLMPQDILCPGQVFTVPNKIFIGLGDVSNQHWFIPDFMDIAASTLTENFWDMQKWARGRGYFVAANPSANDKDLQNAFLDLDVTGLMWSSHGAAGALGTSDGGSTTGPGTSPNAFVKSFFVIFACEGAKGNYYGSTAWLIKAEYGKQFPTSSSAWRGMSGPDVNIP